MSTINEIITKSKLTTKLKSKKKNILMHFKPIKAIEFIPIKIQ